jgi:hypothetical protein
MLKCHHCRHAGGRSLGCGLSKGVTLSCIFFEPWEGHHYNHRGFFPKRMLVLGESYYQRDQNSPLPSEFTKKLIEEQIQEHWRQRFHTKVAIACLGVSPVRAPDKTKFWHSVSHYVYIQESVGTRRRQRPTPDMWRKAGPGFEEVIRKLRPEFILVTGKELWSHVQQLSSEPGPLIDDAELKETRKFSTGSGKFALAFAMKHPASLGFRAIAMKQFIDEALKRAECYPLQP